MLTPTAGPPRPRVLIVDDSLARLDTAIGRAAESIAAALAARNCDVVRALSFQDGEAIVGSDARKARAISSVVRPPSSRSVRATRASVVSTG